MTLPIVNSPRSGQCGYTGLLIAIYFNDSSLLPRYRAAYIIRRLVLVSVLQLR